MDVSQSYINMCNKAKEIQEIAVKPNGDPDQGEYFHCLSCKNRLQEDDGPHGNYYFCHCDGDSIWLPRQDQLQEMVYNPINVNAVAAMFEEVSEFGNTFLLKSPQRTPQSAEQLWLCWIMAEKHKKQWNGKDWIKA